MLDSIIRVKPGIATKNQKSKIKNQKFNAFSNFKSAIIIFSQTIL